MPNSGHSGSESHSQPATDACQLKAGHPPAVKVGNMRVVQRTHSTSSNSEKNDEEKQTGGDSSTVPTACSFAPKTIVKTATSGVPDNIVQSVPEAVKHSHDKPQPSHEYRGHNIKTQIIQQPKK